MGTFANPEQRVKILYRFGEENTIWNLLFGVFPFFGASGVQSS